MQCLSLKAPVTHNMSIASIPVCGGVVSNIGMAKRSHTGPMTPYTPILDISRNYCGQWE